MWITRLTASGSTKHKLSASGERQKVENKDRKMDNGQWRGVIEREIHKENKVRHIGKQSLKEAQRQKRFTFLHNTVSTGQP